MVKKTTEFSLLVAISFIFGYIESLFPLPLPFPGIKLGFANLVLVLALYRSGFFTSLSISIIKNVLLAITFGNPFSFLYSMTGGILSLVIMMLMKKNKHISMLTVSVLGGIFHNIGQLLVAALVIESTSIISYFPFLYFGGMVSGFFIGFISYECDKRLPRSILNTSSKN